MTGALAGIRVVDFGQYLAGPLVAMMLADQGAHVVRVDPPGGPRWQSPANAVLQRGKRSIVLDLKDAGDAAIGRRLVDNADVVIENFRPGVMERLGLGAAVMTAANPGLVYCSIPGFASDDPRAGMPALEGVVGAAAALYAPSVRQSDPSAHFPQKTWMPGSEPVFNALPIASSFAAFMAANSIVAALIARERGGFGQSIEVPLFDASYEAIRYYADALPDEPHPHRFLGAGVGQSAWAGHFECADGRFVNLSWLEGRQLALFGARFGSEDWAELGLLEESRVRADPELAADLVRRLTAIFKTKTAAEWAQIANPDSDLAECLTTAEWLREDEHARSSRAVISLDDPEHGPTNQAGYPVSMTKTPPEARGPRHALDADRASILAELDALSKAPAPASSGQAVALHHALDGFRAVDVTLIIAGPSACRILAEYGAEVIKINKTPLRPLDYSLGVNSGKKTVLLDLKAPESRPIFDRLIETADVFCMNMPLDAAERLCVNEAALRELRPDIVYGCINCFGMPGPRETHRGHEQLGEAVTGMHLRWAAGQEAPMMQHLIICDLGTGQFAAFGMLLGLFHRARTGEGQFVCASLAQTGTYHQIPFMVDYDGRVWDEPAGQRAKGWGPLDRLYAASDRWFYLGAPRADALQRLRGVEGLEGIERVGEGDLESALSERFGREPASVWVERLTAAGLGAQPVLTIEEAMDDPLAKKRGLSRDVEFPGVGPGRLVGPAPRLSRTPVRPGAPSPAGGSHSREIVEDLGFGAVVDDLVAGGVLAEATLLGVQTR